MNTQQLIKMVRRRWLIVAVTTAALLLVSVIVSLVTPPTYQATSRLFVSMPNAASVNEVYQGGLFSQARVASYAKLITSTALAERTIEAMDLDMTPRDLASRVSATVDPGTVLITVKVVDHSPQNAVEIANGVSEAFVLMAAELEAPQNKAGASTRVAVFQGADSAIWVSPNKLRNVILGLGAGIVLGLMLAIGRDRLDNSVKDRTTAEDASGTALVGTIPFDKKIGTAPARFTDDDTVTAEAYRRLRTNLTYLDVDNPPRCIVITSAGPTEGKTVTAVNLAYALAESDSSVLLVEADLRRPGVASYLGATGSVGLTTVLSKQISLIQAVQPTTHAGVDFLATGALPPNPGELLGSARMKLLLAEAKSRYDWIIVDSSPVLPVVDATLLATESDGVLVLARYGKTTSGQLSRTVDDLRSVGATILGTVITFDPTRRERAYHAYSKAAPPVAASPASVGTEHLNGLHSRTESTIESSEMHRGA